MFGDVDARIRKCCTGSLLEFYTYRAERYSFMSSEDMETDVRSLKLKEWAGSNEVCSYGLQNLKWIFPYKYNVLERENLLLHKAGATWTNLNR